MCLKLFSHLWHKGLLPVKIAASFKVIFNMQVVFMGITRDMLPNRIYINLKNELTLENKQ